MNEIRDDLYKAIQAYFDALYFGSVEGFRSVFHPQAQLFSATEGKLVHLDLETYMDLVRNRPSPHAKGDPRQDVVISATVGSVTTAHVRLSDVYLPKRFTDDITFVHIDGRWQIVSKVWHFET